MSSIMRRLVVEIPMEGDLTFDEEDPLQHVRSLEVLLFLRHDREEFAVISKVVLKDERFRIEDVIESIKRLHGQETEIQLLDRSRDGSYTCMIRGKMYLQHFGLEMDGTEGYVTTPFELRNGRFRLTYLGTARQVNVLLQKMKGSGVPCKVISLADAKFAPNSPLGFLTDKQRQALMTAYEAGYYDTPRKVSTEQLANKLGLVSSTFTVHRQKAEKRILDAIVEQS